MENKEIYIDGVDVSGCPHLIEDYQWWNIAGREEHDINICALSFDEYRDFEEDDFCKENPNCYYKQLLRKEQECERLQNIINEAQNSKLDLKSFLVGEAIQNEYEQQLDQLKVENDTLTEQLAEMVSQSALLPKFFGLSAEEIKQLVTKCNQLSKTLAEIKEIAEFYDNSTMEDVCYRGGIEEILQKISECEV